MKKIGHASANGAVTEISTLNWNVWMLMLCLKTVFAVFEKSGRVRKGFPGHSDWKTNLVCQINHVGSLGWRILVDW